MSLCRIIEKPRVIRWHRRARERQRLEDLVPRLDGDDQPTARPPIPLPAVPGIGFLATVGDVVEEGARMKHCIATRALEAIKRCCFLFRVEHRGQQASVEISAEGESTDCRRISQHEEHRRLVGPDPTPGLGCRPTSSKHR